MIALTVDFEIEGQPASAIISRGDMIDRDVADAMVSVGRKVLEHAKQNMQQYLAPGGRFNVGVTGKASQNLSVQTVGMAGNIPVLGIVEGSLTDANQHIRMGRSSGRFPNKPRIMQWVAMRASRGDIQINLETGKALRFVKKKGAAGISRPWKQHRTRSKIKLIEKTSYLIGHGLRAHGGNISHMGLYPSGQPRFDYVTYYVNTRRKTISEQMGREGQLVLGQIMFHYFRKSGTIGTAKIW